MERCPFCNAPNCTAGSHEDLVANLCQHGLIRTPCVREAFASLDRSCFQTRSPHPYRNPYVDGPLPIGFSVQMSAPHVHAATLELIQEHLQTGKQFLDVGSGSGFMCAAMAHITSEDAVVYAREHIPELADHSLLNIADAGAGHLITSGQLIISAGDGLDCAGGSSHDLHDAINCGAAAESIPESLVAELRPGGRLVLPVGKPGEAQWLTCVDKPKDGGAMRVERIMQVVFVPLTSAADQLTNPLKLLDLDLVNTAD